MGSSAKDSNVTDIIGEQLTNVKQTVDNVLDGVGSKISNFELNGDHVSVGVKSSKFDLNSDNVADGVGAKFTNVKLNGENYLLWANAMRVFLRAKKKLKLIVDDPLPKTDEKYEDWEIQNSIVMTWLWDSMEPSIAVKFMHMTTAKKIWNGVKKISQQVGNVGGVCV